MLEAWNHIVIPVDTALNTSNQFVLTFFIKIKSILKPFVYHS